MSRARLSWSAGVLLALLPTTLGIALAAPPQGFITGKVLNAETKEPLPYATVLFQRRIDFGASLEKQGGAYTKLDGTFVGKVPPGTYDLVFTYTSYESQTVKSIFVANGDSSRVATIYLRPAKIELETIKVVGDAIRTREGSMLTKVKNQGTVQEAITSEQISKTTDSNAAEALGRAAGVTVAGGGKYVYVRGLGERYSQTQINGASVGTPEPNKKVLPLDIFPTELLDNVTVQKTYTPDMDGEFAGSVISLNTKEFSKNMFRHSLSLGSTQATTGTGRISYQGGSLDFLGIDDGTRALPSIVEEMAPDTRVTLENFSENELAEMGKAFEDVWTPHGVSTKPNFSYSGLASQQFRPFGKVTGLLASFSISNNHSNIAKEQNTYGGSSDPTPIYDYDVVQSQSTVLWGLNLSGNSELAEGQKLKFNVLYTQHTDDQSRTTEGMNNDRGSYVRFHDLSYIERGLFSGVMQGSHATGFLQSTLDWNLFYSSAKRDEPDRRRSVYEQIDSTFQLTGAGDPHPMTRLYGDSNEQGKGAKLNWTLPFEWQTRASSVKVGAAYDTKDRESNYRRFGFTTRFAGSEIQNVDLTKPAEEQTTDENIEKGLWTIEETTRPNDSYTADQTVKAVYGMVDVPLLSWARMVAGGRFEDSKQGVDAQSLVAVNDPGLRLDRHFQDFLPAVNLTFTPTNSMNVRAAYSKTVNRPELRELSPFGMENFESGYIESGDTSVVRARIENYDLRWELYPGPGEVISFGVFYKKMHDPIVKYVFPNTGGYAEAPTNGVELDGEPGHLSGWEAEARLSFRDIWRGLSWAADLGRTPSLLGRFSVSANHSRVTSESHVVSASQKVMTVRLAGQSDYSSNFGIFYQDRHWDSALLYRSFGPRLYAYGFGSIRDITEYPPESLDFTLSYRLSKNARFKFSAENLLNDRIEFKQGDLITSAYETGTTIGLSVSYNAESAAP